MLAATLSDVVSHRIPNMLLVPALSIALLTGAVNGGAENVLFSLAGLAVGLAMLLPIYAMGAMGAGDVKLLGVAGAFLGPYGALVAGLMTFIAGAVLGILWMSWQALSPVMHTWLQSIGGHASLGVMPAANSGGGKANHSFAYAPAIAVGVAVSVWHQGWTLPF